MSLPKMSEKSFQRQVMQAARLFGWRVCHYAPVRVVRRGGAAHFTPVVGDAGGPDLLLARRGVVLCVELKVDGGRLTDAQLGWAGSLGGCYRLWRPADWPRIEHELWGVS